MPNRSTPDQIDEDNTSASSQPQKKLPAALRKPAIKAVIKKPTVKKETLKKAPVHVIYETDDIFKEQAAGFLNFLRENAVLGLAIGFVAGQQAQTLVKSLISSFIDPAFQLFFGKSLSSRYVDIHFHNHTGNFGWGAFVYALLNVLFVLAAIYAIIKLFKLDRLNKPKEVTITEQAAKDTSTKTEKSAKTSK